MKFGLEMSGETNERTHCAYALLTPEMGGKISLLTSPSGMTATKGIKKGVHERDLKRKRKVEKEGRKKDIQFY